jgi:hypothetical protein
MDKDLFPEDCQHAIFQPKLARYEPLGEWGWACGQKYGDGCNGRASECPLWQRQGDLCPTCIQDGKVVQMLAERYTGQVFCEQCGADLSCGEYLRRWEVLARSWNVKNEEGAL